MKTNTGLINHAFLANVTCVRLEEIGTIPGRVKAK
jgi:hypothetical protein